jgi:hypothetical protein
MLYITPEAEHLDIYGCSWVKPAFNVTVRCRIYDRILDMSVFQWHVGTYITPNQFNCRLTVAHCIQATHQYAVNAELKNIFVVKVRGNVVHVVN